MIMICALIAIIAYCSDDKRSLADKYVFTAIVTACCVLLER